MRTALSLALGVALLPGAALAHTTLIETEATAGSSFKAVFAVPHGCGTAATTELHVALPEGFVEAKPMPKAGWTLAVTESAFAAAYEVHGRTVSSGPTEIRWTGGRLDDAWYDEFTVHGTFAGFPVERRVAFPVTQVCEDGATVAWDEVVPAGADAHSAEHAAPVVTVHLAQAGAHEGHDMGAMSAPQGAPAAAAAEPLPGTASAGAISIESGFARAMLPGQKVGGGYLTIENTGDRPDRLLSVSTPMAKSGSVHEMTMKGDVMTMREMKDGIEIPAGGSVVLAPGGLHLMFTDVSQPFAQGSAVPVTLVFEHAGSVGIALPVTAPGAKAPGGGAKATGGGHENHQP